MKGVGAVWYYPDGVANILSQFRMIAHSKWRMTYDTAKYHKSGNIEDLCYDVITSEGHRCKFIPTRQGLHVYKIQCKNSKDILGSRCTDNKTIFGGSCHTLVESEDEPFENLTGVSQEGVEVTGVTNEEKDSSMSGAINTIEKSRNRFSKRD